MCDPVISGIDRDPMLPYYTYIKNQTVKCAANVDMYTGYDHAYTTNTVEKLLCWISCVTITGVNAVLKVLSINVENMTAKRGPMKFQRQWTIIAGCKWNEQ